MGFTDMARSSLKNNRVLKKGLRNKFSYRRMELSVLDSEASKTKTDEEIIEKWDENKHKTMNKVYLVYGALATLILYILTYFT